MAKKPTTEGTSKSGVADADQTSQARRRLLKLGAYVPPAIVGMVIIGSTSKAFANNSYKGHNIGSCMPSACNPCVDYDDEEHSGKKSSESDHQNKNKRSQCDVEKAKKDYNDKHKDDDKH